MKNNIQNNDIKKFFNKIKFVPEYSTSFSKQSIYLFFFFYVLIPMVISFILFIIQTTNTNIDTNSNLFPLINSAFVSIALLILAINNRDHFWKNGFWLLLFFPLFQLISSYISQINIEIFTGTSLGDFLQLIFVIGATTLATIFYFFQNKNQELFNLRNSLKISNLLTTIVIVVIGLGLVISINFALTSFTKEVIGGGSLNQGVIEDDLKGKNVVKIITTIFGLLVAAPIMEELLYRKTLAEIADNKWWMIIISTVFFAFWHIQTGGDWENILPFLPLGLINSTIYFYFRNTTPIIIIHFGSNLIALILFYL